MLGSFLTLAFGLHAISFMLSNASPSYPRKNSLSATSLPSSLSPSSLVSASPLLPNPSSHAILHSPRSHFEERKPGKRPRKPLSVPLSGFEAKANSALNQRVWKIAVSVNDETFELVFHTRYTDTWIPTTDFRCFTPKGSLMPQEHCKIKKTYPQDITPMAGWTLSQVYESFSPVYVSNEFVTGKVAAAHFSLAKRKVENVPIAFADIIAWEGDGETSGVLGFGRPSNTGIFVDLESKKEATDHTVLQRICRKYGLPVRFGISFEDESTGLLVIGGRVAATSSFESLMVGSEYEVEVTEVAGFKTNLFAKFDTGTDLIMLPFGLNSDSLADRLASMLDPEWKYDPAVKLYQIETCNNLKNLAPISFSFGRRKKIDINPEHLVHHGDKPCHLALRRAEEGQIILGLPFLRNVLLDVDVENEKIGLTQATLPPIQ